MNILWGLFGCSIIIIASFLLSENKKSINVRTVTIGFILQVIFGYLVLKWQLGKDILAYVSGKITEIIDFGHEGLEFVFGPLANEGSEMAVWGVNVLGDRKSTRLNSSHVAISYAVFCLKEKKDVSWILHSG